MKLRHKASNLQYVLINFEISRSKITSKPPKKFCGRLHNLHSVDITGDHRRPGPIRTCRRQQRDPRTTVNKTCSTRNLQSRVPTRYQNRYCAPAAISRHSLPRTRSAQILDTYPADDDRFNGTHMPNLTASSLPRTHFEKIVLAAPRRPPPLKMYNFLGWASRRGGGRRALSPCPLSA